MIELRVNLDSETIRADLAKRNEIKVMMTEKGADGKTPIKGVDYLTAEDIQQITNQVYIDADIEVATIEDIKRLF